MPKRAVLAIGAHPDDIEYGCGGTLRKMRNDGYDVFLYVASAGSFGGDPGTRVEEQQRAAELIGASEVFMGGFNDTEIRVSQEIIHSLEQARGKCDPSIVLVHFTDDTHQDHRNLSKAAISANRYVDSFYFYEGPTTQNFLPTVFSDIGSVIEDKIEILKAHHSQVTRTNIENLSILDMAMSTATFRGTQGRRTFCEAFQPLRSLLKF